MGGHFCCTNIFSKSWVGMKLFSNFLKNLFSAYHIKNGIPLVCLDTFVRVWLTIKKVSRNFHSHTFTGKDDVVTISFTRETLGIFICQFILAVSQTSKWLSKYFHHLTFTNTVVIQKWRQALTNSFTWEVWLLTFRVFILV